MTTRFIESDRDRSLIHRFIDTQELPFTLSVSKGGKRSVKQNRLQMLWLNEIAGQLEGQSVEDLRAYCKLTIGVPILRAEDETFREKYDAVVRPLPYEKKIALMKEPLDFPVTRLMTTRQATTYLEGIHRHFSEQGIALTDPGDLLRNYEQNSPAAQPNPTGEQGSGALSSPSRGSAAAQSGPEADLAGRNEARAEPDARPASNSYARIRG